MLDECKRCHKLIDIDYQALPGGEGCYGGNHFCCQKCKAIMEEEKSAPKTPPVKRSWWKGLLWN